MWYYYASFGLLVGLSMLTFTRARVSWLYKVIFLAFSVVLWPIVLEIFLISRR